MFSQLFDLVFGCRHANYSFPFSAKAAALRSRAASSTGTYVVCLSCGKELPYDWNAMRVVASNRRTEHQEAPSPASLAA
jgi:hypothetical protein